MHAAAAIVLAAAVCCLLLSAWLLKVNSEDDPEEKFMFNLESAHMAWTWWRNKRMREGKAAPKRRGPKTKTGPV